MSEALVRPFTISGHHLATYMELVRPTGLDAENMASWLNDKAQVWRGQLTAENVNFAVLERQADAPQQTYLATYGYDLVGESPTQAAAHKSKLATTLRQFVALDNTAPVEILSKGQDAICGSCTFKRHCALPVTDRLDEAPFRFFKQVSEVIATSSKEIPKQTTEQSLITNAHQVRKTLGYMGLLSQIHHTTFNDLVKQHTS